MLNQNGMGNRFISDHQLQTDNLQTHLAQLNNEYQATMRQFDCTLTGADRVNLEARLAEIDRQMSEIEREIRLVTRKLDDRSTYTKRTFVDRSQHSYGGKQTFLRICPAITPQTPQVTFYQIANIGDSYYG